MAAPRIPLEMARAARNAREGDPDALLTALEGLEAKQEGLGWLSLWRVCAEDTSPDFVRTLTFALAKYGEDSPYKEAVRLWAAEIWDGEDLSTMVNLLTGFQGAVEDNGKVPLACATALLSFVNRCLNHDEAVVRYSGLDFLEVACDNDAIRGFVHRPSGRELADRLTQLFQASADEEEKETLHAIVKHLCSTNLPELAPSHPRVLRRLVLDLEDAAERLNRTLSGLEPLLTTVRRRTLFDDALAEAVKFGGPVQTVRLANATPRIGLVESFLGFGEAVVRQFHQPTENAILDFGIHAVAAQAASFPVHLTYESGGAEAVFKVLSDLFAYAKNPKHEEAAKIDEFSPPVAAAALRLLRYAHDGGLVEVILSDPTRADTQRSIQSELEGDNLARIHKKLAKAARQAQRVKVWVQASDVPQANTVELVFQAVDAMISRGEVTIHDLEGVTAHRQVNYYRQGARVLGLFDDDNLPTRRARSLVGLDREQRLALAAIFFEDSVIGRAWREWCGVDRLSDVSVDTARDFLEDSVVGLSGTTVPRRVSTLANWHNALVPYHYATKE